MKMFKDKRNGRIGLVIMILVIAMGSVFLFSRRNGDNEIVDKDDLQKLIEEIDVSWIQYEENESSYVYRLEVTNDNELELKECTMNVQIKMDGDNSGYTDWIEALPIASNIESNSSAVFELDLDKSTYENSPYLFDKIYYELRGYFSNKTEANSFFVNGPLEY